MYKFELATLDHVKGIADNLQPEVLKELQAVTFTGSIEEAVAKCVTDSHEVWVASDDDGDMLGMFGIKVPDLLSGKAYPFLLTTSKVLKYKRDFVKATKVGLDYWLKEYHTLTNYVPERCTGILRWAKRCGFTVSPGVVIPRTNISMCKIEIKRG